MSAPLRAPFPYFGGKRLVAAEVWARLGDVAVYAEPFAGSLAVLLGRHAAEWRDGRVETVNDLDGFVANAWRAILHDPEQTAYRADWPSNENDLHARHAWLVEQREQLTRRIEGDPDYYDARIAGWWLWGIAQWIGGGWCSGVGPWTRVQTEAGWVLTTTEGDAGRGVSRRRLGLVSAGRGVSRSTLGSAGLLPWLLALSERLRRVRVCSGDWARILTPSALACAVGGPRGILLDPPYSAEADRHECYALDSGTVAHDVRAWCESAPADYRIALCGYIGEGHDSLTERGWSCHRWTAQGGMQRDKQNPGNREREAIWFSPACLAPAQLTLFEAAQ